MGKKNNLCVYLIFVEAHTEYDRVEYDISIGWFTMQLLPLFHAWCKDKRKDTRAHASAIRL